MTPRKRNVYDPKSKEPFQASRTKIDLFLKCPRCYYLDQRLGIKRPSGAAFSLNVAVDELLKKEFDIHRAAGNRHPLMKEYGVDAIPFVHPDLEIWRKKFAGVRYVDPETNFEVTGEVDDIWVKPNGELIVVDYKATSKKGEVDLDGPWQQGYKRQLEVYQWILRRNGFAVSSRGYFVYVNGRKDVAAFDGKLEFVVKLIPYDGDDSWVEGALVKMRKCLRSKVIPKAAEDCEYCGYANNLLTLLPSVTSQS